MGAARKFKANLLYRALRTKNSSLVELVLPDSKSILFKLTKGKSGRILVKQQPVTNGITGEKPFSDLIEVLSKGFKGKVSFGIKGHLLSNVTISLDKSKHGSWGRKITQKGISKGDRYSVELTPSVVVRKPFEVMNIFLDKFSSEKILRVTIVISENA